MSGRQWVAAGGFVAIVAALLLAAARLEPGVAAIFAAGFGAYSVAVLRNAERVPARVRRRRVTSRALLAARRRTPPGSGRR